MKYLLSIAIAIFCSTFAFSQTQNPGNTDPFSFNDSTSNFNLGSMFGSMMPMYKSMTSQMMEGAIEFYEQPGMIQRIATLNKKYYDALKASGFSDDQAMRILTSSPLSVGMTGSKQ